MEEENKTEEKKPIGKILAIVCLIVSMIGLWAVCIFIMINMAKVSENVEDLSEQINELSNKLEEYKADVDTVSANEAARRAEEERIKREEEELLAAQAEAEANKVVKHRIYLTFDDGPSSNTNQILDILDQYGVKATFFVVGKEGDSSKAAMNRIVSEGHTLAMHSYSHKYDELYESLETFDEDFNQLFNLIYETTGQEPKYYRFPGGSSNTVSKVDMQVFAEYLDGKNIIFYDWNADSGDGMSKSLTEEELLENSLVDVDKRETTVLLMHDAANRETTVSFLPRLIESILEIEGAEILPITEETKPVQHIKYVKEEEKTETDLAEDSGKEVTEETENAEGSETDESKIDETKTDDSEVKEDKKESKSTKADKEKSDKEKSDVEKETASAETVEEQSGNQDAEKTE